MTTADLTPAVELAIAQLLEVYPARVLVAPDGSGGGRVIVEGIPLPGGRLQPATWIGFYMTYVHPSADIYPYYVRADLFVDGTAPTPPLSAGHQFLERPALMLSRRTPRHQATPDVALLKLEKIVTWLGTLA